MMLQAASLQMLAYTAFIGLVVVDVVLRRVSLEEGELGE